MRLRLYLCSWVCSSYVGLTFGRRRRGAGGVLVVVWFVGIAAIATGVFIGVFYVWVLLLISGGFF